MFDIQIAIFNINTSRQHNTLSKSDIILSKIQTMLYFATILLTLLPLTVLALTAPPDLNYSYFLSLQTSQGYHGVRMNPDNSLLLLYHRFDQQPLIYDAFTWQSVHNVSAYTFANAVQFHFFTDGKGIPNCIYSTKKQVILRTYAKEQYSDRVLLNYSCGQYSNDLDLSDDGQLWAATCFGSDTFYIGRVDGPQDSAEKVVVKPGTVGNQVSWGRNTHDLAVTGSKNTLSYQNSYLYLVDGQTYEYQEIPIIDNQIFCVAFSPLGLMVYLDTDIDSENTIVKRYNITSGKVESWHLGVQTQYPSIRGHFLALNIYVTDQGSYTYYYHLDQPSFDLNDFYYRVRTYEYNYGQTHSSTFVFSTAPQINTTIDVYKLCSADGYLYNQQLFICQKCDDSCLTCQYRSTTCLNCYNRSYYYQQINRSCLACSGAIPMCQTCSNGSVCETCPGRYFLSDNTCTLCDAVMEGCRSCQNGQLCSDCYQTYFIDGKGCRHCYEQMAGCSRCSNKSQCSECQPSYAVNLQGTCSKCYELIQGCVSCQVRDICLQCDNYHLISNESHCSKCSELMEGCSTCSSADKCSKCIELYAINSQGTCSPCNKLIQNCINCSSKNTCTQCPQLYAVHLGKCSRCQDLMQGCSDCSSAEKCITCEDGYVIDYGTSVCYQPKDYTVLIVLVGVAFITVIVIGIVCVRRWRIRQRKLKQIKELKEIMDLGNHLQEQEQPYPEGGFLIPE